MLYLYFTVFAGFLSEKIKKSAHKQMKPKFKTITAWEQAQVLMQPAFIRVIDNIRKELEISTWVGTYQELDAPYPNYLLCLTYKNQSVTVDIWELCFQVCFSDYPNSDSPEVDIDTSLLDEEGMVDWHSLESKTQNLVKRLFANLPTDIL